MILAIDIIVASAWALFLGVVITLSRRVGRDKTLKYDKRGSLLMKIQYTIFFTILVHSYIYRFDRFHEVLAIIGTVLLVLGLMGYFYTLSVFSSCYNPMVCVREKQGLCTRGPYRHVRHPLFSCQMVAMIGTALAIQHPAYLALPLAFYVMYRTSKKEEALLCEYFEKYERYRRETKMFVPRLL